MESGNEIDSRCPQEVFITSLNDLVIIVDLSEGSHDLKVENGKGFKRKCYGQSNEYHYEVVCYC